VAGVPESVTNRPAAEGKELERECVVYIVWAVGGYRSSYVHMSLI
jgi:hypothetical protein